MTTTCRENNVFNLLANLRSGPFLASPVCSLRSSLSKIGPDHVCNLSRNVLAILWRDKLHETFYSVTYPATAKIVVRQVARAVFESRTTFRATCLATILAVAGYVTL